MQVGEVAKHCRLSRVECEWSHDALSIRFVYLKYMLTIYYLLLIIKTKLAMICCLLNTQHYNIESILTIQSGSSAM
jgi:hypothetical protein